MSRKRSTVVAMAEGGKRGAGRGIRRVHAASELHRQSTEFSADERRLARVQHFHDLVELIADVPGTVVECGVGAGKTLLPLTILTQESRLPRPIWAFDSFEGLPAPSAEDDPGIHGQPLEGLFAHSEDAVRERLAKGGVSRVIQDERIRFVHGYYPGSFPEYSGEPIALLHVDVDLYQSCRDCLEYFEPMVGIGGVITFDEYQHPSWPGATRAIDQYYGGPPPGLRPSPHWPERLWYLVKH